METPGTWVFVKRARFVSTPVYEGLSALRIRANYGHDYLGGDATMATPFQSVPGTTHTVTFQLRRGGTQDDPLTLYIDPGSGAFTESYVYETADIASGMWTEQTVEFTAVGTASRLRFHTDDPPPPQPPFGTIGQTEWFVDAIEVSSDVITTSLTDALVADLTAIDGTGAFYTTLATIAEDGVMPPKIVPPAAIFSFGDGGVEDPEDGSKNIGIARQSWDVEIVTRTADSRSDIERLLDDVRLAVGRTDSNLAGVPGVITAAVVDWTDADRSSPDQHQQWMHMTITVEVHYTYNRSTLVAA